MTRPFISAFVQRDGGSLDCVIHFRLLPGDSFDVEIADMAVDPCHADEPPLTDAERVHLSRAFWGDDWHRVCAAAVEARSSLSARED